MTLASFQAATHAESQPLESIPDGQGFFMALFDQNKGTPFLAEYIKISKSAVENCTAVKRLSDGKTQHQLSSLRVYLRKPPHG